MAFQQFGKGALRVAKNYVKSYSDTQAKVREATSNDPSGPSGTLMNEIAQMSYNQNDFVEIMEMLDKRLNDKGKNWRHVFKSLTVLDYLLHVGSENVVLYFRDNLWIIKTLEEFQYVDEDRKDCGSNVRQKAKHILNLLSDPARLQEERRTRASMRDPMIKGQANRGPDRDEDELRKAIEASKKTLAEEPEENDLATAIRLSESRYPQQFMTAEGGVSEEEEATRHKAVKDSHVDSLFDDRAQTSLSTGSNNNNPFPFIDHTSYATGLLPQAQGAPRVAKKYTKGYLDTQAKVLEATSNDPTGPSGTQMSEIAKLSYNQKDFDEVMEMLDKRLNDKGKNWRHVFKSLTVLNYLLHAGSENVFLYFSDNLHIIKTLTEFQYVDEDGKDCGANIRQKAKDISNLLSDPARLQEERRTRESMHDRVVGWQNSAAPQVPFMQAEFDTHSSIPPETILQDLTQYITKTEDHPVDRGGFGEIWKCTYQMDQGPLKQVAVKSLLVYTSDQLGKGMEKKTKRIRHELRTCARLKHANILPVYGYTYGFGTFMAIVSPWAENGNLTTYLENENASISAIRRFQILRDITVGLQYLHANNVIHGDLTGPNVLIFGDGTACLADFGLSLVFSDVTSISQASWTSNFHGNSRWLAPELLEGQDDELVRPNMQSDIYSFGGIMLQVLTGKIPYYYLVNNAAVIRCIFTKDKPDRSRYPAVSDEYWYFIGECWSTAPHNRPSADRVVEVIKDEFDSLSSLRSSSDS